MRCRLTAILAVLIFLVSGCDQKAMLQKFIPESEDRLARQFLEKIIDNRLDEALSMVAPALQGPEGRNGLEQLAHLLHGGNVETIENIGAFTRISFPSGKTLRSVELSYQLRLASGWAAGVIVINEQDGTRQITTARFNPLSDSLEHLNRFTLSGKGPIHFLFLAFAILIPAFCITSLVLCVRSPINKKWLWIIFILIGLFTLKLNWTTGQIDYQTISFLFLGAAAFRPGFCGPWTVSLALPIGAIIFLLKRKELIAKKAAGRVSPPPTPSQDQS